MSAARITGTAGGGVSSKSALVKAIETPLASALSATAAAQKGSTSDASTSRAPALAADICYEAPLAERVVAWLKAARAAGTRVLVGDPGRTYFPKSGLLQLAEYRVPTTRELEDIEVKRTGVWTFA